MFLEPIFEEEISALYVRVKGPYKAELERRYEQSLQSLYVANTESQMEINWINSVPFEYTHIKSPDAHSSMNFSTFVFIKWALERRLPGTSKRLGSFPRGVRENLHDCNNDKFVLV